MVIDSSSADNTPKRPARQAVPDAVPAADGFVLPASLFAPTAARSVGEGDVQLDNESGRALRKLHGELMSHKRAKAFNAPIDHFALGLDDYLRVVPVPMDLGTVKQRLHGGRYASLRAYAADAALVFRNALHYNRFDTDVYFDAVFMWQKLDALLLERTGLRDPVPFACDTGPVRPHVSTRGLRAVHARLCGMAGDELEPQAEPVVLRRMLLSDIERDLHDGTITSKEEVGADAIAGTSLAAGSTCVPCTS